jgi:hypothetical protein
VNGERYENPTCETAASISTVTYIFIENRIAQKGETKTMPLSEETRQKLAAKLNKIIDIPLVGEDHEQIMAEQIIEMCLASYSDVDMEEMKNTLKMQLVEKLNSAVNIPFASEEMEAAVFAKVADFILKEAFDAAADQDDDDDDDNNEDPTAAEYNEQEDSPEVAEYDEHEV